MRFLNFLSLVLGLAWTNAALPQVREIKTGRSHPARHTTGKRASDIIIKDFLISDIYSHSFFDPTETAWNRTLSFFFTDPNSNTSTICTDSWTQTNTTNNAPFSYVACDLTGNEDEFYQWHFVSYTNLMQFQIEFSHTFSDPINYPPPYNVVEYLSTANISLTCSDAAGLSGCTLPAAQSPLHAPIDGIAD